MTSSKKKTIKIKGFEDIEWEVTPGGKDTNNTFLYSFLNAFSNSFREGKVDGSKMSRDKIMQNIRTDLLFRLHEKDKNNKSGYDTFMSSENSSKEYPPESVTLEALENILTNNLPFNQILIEFVSYVFNKDIIVIEKNKVNDNLSIIKGKNVIFLLFNKGIYSLLSLRINGASFSYFSKDNEIVKRFLENDSDDGDSEDDYSD